MLTITATARETSTLGATLRAQGKAPAVVYGPQTPATSLAIDAAAFMKVWKEAGEATIVSVTGVGSDHDVLIHDVQLDPVTGSLVHVDLYAFDKNKKLTATIPLHFVGHSAAEKAGAVIIKVLHEIEIEVLPSELPSHIDVDVAKLAQVNDHITLADLVFPQSAVVSLEMTEIVATAAEAKEEVIEAAAPTVAPQVAEAQAQAAAAAATKAPDADKKKSD